MLQPTTLSLSSLLSPARAGGSPMTTTSDFALALADLASGPANAGGGEAGNLSLIEIMPIRPEVAATGNALPVLVDTLIATQNVTPVVAMSVVATPVVATPVIAPPVIAPPVVAMSVAASVPQPVPIAPTAPPPEAASQIAPIATVLAAVAQPCSQAIVDTANEAAPAPAVPTPVAAPVTQTAATAVPQILPRHVAKPTPTAEATVPEDALTTAETEVVPQAPVTPATRRTKTVAIATPPLPAEPNGAVIDTGATQDTADLSDARPRKGKKAEVIATVQVTPVATPPVIAIAPVATPVVVAAAVSATPVVVAAAVSVTPILVEGATVAPAVGFVAAKASAPSAAPTSTVATPSAADAAPIRPTTPTVSALVGPDRRGSPIPVAAPAVEPRPAVVAPMQSQPLAAPAFRADAPPVASQPVDPLPAEVKVALSPATLAPGTPAPAVAPQVDVATEAARPVAKPNVITVALPTAAPAQKPAEVLPAAQAFAQAMFATPQAATDTDDSDSDALPVSAIGGTGPNTTTGPAPVAVTATAAADRNALDMSRGDWMMSMIDKIETLRDESGAVGETRLKLSPDALGNVDVTVRRDDSGQYQVRITADTAQARTILADAAPRLNDMAEARGLKLSQAGVDTGTGANAGFADSNRRDEQQTATAPRRPASAFTDSGAEGDPTTQDTRIA